MRTTIHFVDGRIEDFDDMAPAVDTHERTLTFITDEVMSVGDVVPLDEISRIDFVVDTAPVGPCDPRD